MAQFLAQGVSYVGGGVRALHVMAEKPLGTLMKLLKPNVIFRDKYRCPYNGKGRNSMYGRMYVTS